MADVQLIVFQISNFGFSQVGTLNLFSSLIWRYKYQGYAQCELWAPVTKENASLLVEGNVIWKGGTDAFIIEIVKTVTSENGSMTYQVKGRTLEALLTYRIVWGTYSVTMAKPVSTLMYGLVKDNCVSPTVPERLIKYTDIFKEGTNTLGDPILYQKTGGELYDAVSDLASDADLGFNVIFDPTNQSMMFKVFKGVSRTIYQSVVDPVVLSAELDDILSSEYYTSSQGVKNMALVAGEDSGAQRKTVETGATMSSGFSRRELYVDARDLQSEVTTDGSTTTLTPDQYNKVLVQRGNEKLTEFPKVFTFDADVRVNGSTQYKFGKDYKLGDYVTVIDERLNLKVSARASEAEESYGDEYQLSVTFGFSSPTMLDRMRQQINTGGA